MSKLVKMYLISVAAQMALPCMPPPPALTDSDDVWKAWMEQYLGFAKDYYYALLKMWDDEQSWPSPNVDLMSALASINLGADSPIAAFVKNIGGLIPGPIGALLKAGAAVAQATATPLKTGILNPTPPVMPTVTPVVPKPAS